MLQKYNPPPAVYILFGLFFVIGPYLTGWVSLASGLLIAFLPEEKK